MLRLVIRYFGKKCSISAVSSLLEFIRTEERKIFYSKYFYSSSCPIDNIDNIENRYSLEERKVSCFDRFTGLWKSSRKLERKKKKKKEEKDPLLFSNFYSMKLYHSIACHQSLHFAIRTSWKIIKKLEHTCHSYLSTRFEISMVNRVSSYENTSRLPPSVSPIRSHLHQRETLPQPYYDCS